MPVPCRVPTALLLAGFGMACAVPLAAAPPGDEVARACAEDGSGEAPTYSVRFDPRDGGESGSAFAGAKARALRYCAHMACTVAGGATARTATVYAVGSLARGRLIVGFRCVPGAAAAAAPDTAAYPLERASDIDAALAKAREHCAPGGARPELSDLAHKSGTLVAVFSCGQ